MSDFHPRMNQATKMVRQFEQFVQGLEEHPRALEGVPRRIGVRSVKAILTKLRKIEAKREKHQMAISELNREEEELLMYHKPDLKKIKKLVKAVYSGNKGVWDDFVE